MQVHGLKLNFEVFEEGNETSWCNSKTGKNPVGMKTILKGKNLSFVKYMYAPCRLRYIHVHYKAKLQLSQVVFDG